MSILIEYKYIIIYRMYNYRFNIIMRDVLRGDNSKQTNKQTNKQKSLIA